MSSKLEIRSQFDLVSELTHLFCEELKEEGFEVDTFVEEKSIVLGYFGTKIPPNKNDKIVGIGEYKIDDYSLIIISSKSIYKNMLILRVLTF